MAQLGRLSISQHGRKDTHQNDVERKHVGVQLLVPERPRTGLAANPAVL